MKNMKLCKLVLRIYLLLWFSDLSLKSKYQHKLNKLITINLSFPFCRFGKFFSLRSRWCQYLNSCKSEYMPFFDWALLEFWSLVCDSKYLLRLLSGIYKYSRRAQAKRLAWSKWWRLDLRRLRWFFCFAFWVFNMFLYMQMYWMEMLSSFQCHPMSLIIVKRVSSDN